MRSTVRLVGTLSAVAIAAFLVRGVAIGQVYLAAGWPSTWTRLLAIELTNGLGWAAWAALLVPLAANVEARHGARRNGLRVGLAVAPAVLVPLPVSVLHYTLLNPGGSATEAFVHVLTHNLPLNLMLGVAMVSIAAGVLGQERMRRLELASANLNAQLTQAQLETLRSQLNPHFLFNALNSVTVLARRGDTERVEYMISHLAALLRYSLESARSQHVPLRVEIEALRHYTDIERVRFGDRLRVAIDVPERLLTAMVPSFALQPLVENAIRHGGDDPGRPLSVSVVARSETGRLVLEVTDDGVGMDAHDPPPRDGFGLGNTRARLAGLYGADASLTMRPNPGRGTIVTIAVPTMVPSGATA